MFTLAHSVTHFISMRDRIRDAILTPLVPLEMTCRVTAEPVLFQDRLDSAPTNVAVGDTWGSAPFDCAWFHFQATIPSQPHRPLSARIDVNGEILLVDNEGTPLRALTNVTSEFARCHGEPGKVEFPLPKEMIATGRVEFWGDAACNDLFGGWQGQGRIVHAEVCEMREDLRALYYDFEVLCDVLVELADDQALCDKVSTALGEVCKMLEDALEPKCVDRARKFLAHFFTPSDHTDSLNIWAVGHAHLDLAWLWPIRETIRKGIRTFATALANQKLYPEHILGMSQPQLYAWIKERDPEFYERIRRAVKDGVVEIQGRFWVEPDCNIPNGESLVRQVLYGARFFQDEFGYAPTECWQPDVFGYNGQLPQILANSGHDVFMTQKLSWNMINRFPHHSFHWEGIDGTSILTHMLPEETYNGPAAPRSLKKIRDEYAQRDVSGHALMCYGIGDGGAGPGIEHLERLRRLAAFESLPRVRISRTPEFFAEWKKDADKFPRWKGELYLEKHQGTLTTQALAKKNNRQCEIALRDVEALSILAANLSDYAYPKRELDDIWKEVLLYQFHDILPGSSIRRVYDESSARYVVLLQQLEVLRTKASKVLARHFSGDPLAAVFNILTHARTEWLQCDGQWHRVTTPGMAYSRIPEEATPVEGLLRAGNDVLENGLLRVMFAADGSIASLFDKRTSRDLVRADTTCNRLVVFPDKGDAWDFDADIPRKNVWRFMEEPPAYPALVSSEYCVEGPNATIHQTYRIGQSTIEQTIQLQAGCDQLVFDTRVDWHETAHMLKVIFPTVITADNARFEIPFGSLRRSTREDNSIQKAQFEVPVQQWLDLSEPGVGLAFYNDCKYGFRVKHGQIEMTALRSVPHPSCAVITVDDAGTPGQSAVADYGDLGQHVFRYAVQPHDGAIGEAELTARARIFNTPLLQQQVGEAAIECGSFIEIDHLAIELVALKQAESGEDMVLRLCNVSTQPVSAEIASHWPLGSVHETDLLEHRLASIHLNKTKSFRIRFEPFEIKTVVLTTV